MKDADRRERLETFAAKARLELEGFETPAGTSALVWVLEQPEFVERDGVWCEFGVAYGHSLRRLAEARGNATLWGFDSFRGLPEDWIKGHPKGHFAVGSHVALPPDGVNLVVGWYKDTLPAFWPPDPITFALVDCDLYSSATEVFWQILPQTNEGAVIVIDDFFVEPYDNGVLRAFLEFLEDPEHRFPFEWLARSGEQVALRVLPWSALRQGPPQTNCTTPPSA